ncbi:murinoglobulin-1-like [Lingula anatina]|uniref:Murinoglobulin-1-like n=1 Tax=Lingula anatina TaxID=7574 RepID=A0A1S3HNZ9_LINAN|nr:murinoglobulin-1-like [Lingula anatina]|eukprot:XP_013387266.1 murinoglobulin-1-like [Lingula anatina]
MVHSLKNESNAGIPILKWLVTEQNSYGGFGSTQDTVTALAALTNYGALYSKTRDLNIEVSTGAFSRNFLVNDNNAMVLQMAELPDVASEVQVSANGHGSALLQVTARYNVKSEAREKSFMLNVTIVEETQNFLKLRIYMRYLCFSVCIILLQI